MSQRLNFIESPTDVRVGETIVWDFDTTPWHTSPSAPVVTAIRTDTGADVTAAMLGSGQPSIAGTIYTLPPASGWITGVQYRITAQFSAAGNVFRPWLDVHVVA